MAMDTHLTVTEATIIPARSMEALAAYTANSSLVALSKPLTECLFWMLKADSNNADNVLVPEDLRALKQHLAWYKQVKEHLRLTSDQPTGALESELAILFPSPIEMRRFNNKSWEQVGVQVHRLLKVLMSAGANAVQSYVDEATWLELDKVEEVLGKTIATFLDGSIRPAQLKALGRLVPDPDFDYEVMREPSPDKPRLNLPDAVDTPLAPRTPPPGGL